jgi:HK97 family phage major capsid protein
MGVLRLSHGFKADQFEPIKNSGGFKFSKWSMLEVSLVSVPANPQAEVLALTTKSFEHPAVQAWVKSFVKGQEMPDKIETPVLTAEAIEKAVSDGMTKALATLAATAKGGDGANADGAGGTGTKTPTMADLLKANAGGSGNGTDIRVKSVGEKYSRSTVTLKHAKSGELIRDPWGREPQSMSELNHAKAGAFLKKLAKKAGIQPAVLTEEDNALLELTYGEKWCGDYGGQYCHDAIDGMRMKDLLSDSVSGGTNAVPFWFDVDLVSFPLLQGELFPYVDVRNVPRGNSVHAASVANPTVTWDVAEGTEINLFDTSSFIAAIDSTIFPVTCAITVGRDFLADSPADVGRVITENIGMRLGNELDKIVAVGNGSTQPTGIFVASGTDSVNAANTTSGPPVLSDYSALLFGIGKQYRNAAGRCCFISNDVSYQRSRNLQVAQATAFYTGATPSVVNQLPLMGIDSFNAYSGLGWPWRISPSCANGEIAFGAMAKYRMYRRLGFEIRWITEGLELARRNEVALIVRGRFGGQPIDTNAFAVQTDGQS